MCVCEYECATVLLFYCLNVGLCKTCIYVHMWVANDSLKAENKWTDGFVHPVCLVVGTQHISPTERHEVKAVLDISAEDLSLSVPHRNVVCFAFRLILISLRGAV